MNGLSSQRQRGAVLFVALVMLLLITLAAVSGMRGMQLEGRMTGNRLEQQRLMSAAESALREGEGRLSGVRTEDEGLFVLQHQYWQQTMIDVLAAEQANRIALKEEGV